MQIFEVTTKSKLSEINYGAFVKGVGSQLAQNIKTDLGIQPSVDKVSGVAAQQKASAATIGVAKQQAQQQQQIWNKTLEELKKDVAERGLSQIPPRDLAQNFMKQLQGMLTPHGLRATMGTINGVPMPEIDDFSDQVDAEALGGQARQEAAVIIDDIDDAVAGILTAQPSTSPATLAQLWQNLAVKISAAANLVTFSPNASKQRGASMPGGTVARGTDPRAQQAMSAMGIDAQGLAGLASVIQANGGFRGQPTKDPIVDALLKAAGIIR